MAWEWVSPVAAASGGVFGGGIGAFFTWKTGKQSRDQSLATLREQLGDARLLAREEREQERLANAYQELLKMAERVGQWAQFVYPLWDPSPSSMPDVQLPPLEVQADAAALVEAFGSDQVRDKSEAWQNVVKGMVSAAQQVAWEEADPSGKRWSEVSPRKTILDLRPEELRTLNELKAQVRSELRFLYRSSAKASGFIRSYTMPSRQEPPSGQLTSAESPEP